MMLDECTQLPGQSRLSMARYLYCTVPEFPCFKENDGKKGRRGENDIDDTRLAVGRKLDTEHAATEQNPERHISLDIVIEITAGQLVKIRESSESRMPIQCRERGSV